MHDTYAVIHDPVIHPDPALGADGAAGWPGGMNARTPRQCGAGPVVCGGH
jgi:hypothetical protein